MRRRVMSQLQADYSYFSILAHDPAAKSHFSTDVSTSDETL
jgi:hypothetical protein